MSKKDLFKDAMNTVTKYKPYVSSYYPDGGINFGSVEEPYTIIDLPDKVVFNKKKGTTVLLYGEHGDYTPTIVRVSKGDKFDKKHGFLLAYFQKLSGLSKTQANKYLKKLVEDDE